MLMARVHLMFLFIRKQLITAMHIAIQPFMHLTYIYFAFNIDANTVNMWTLALCHTLQWFAPQERLTQPAGWLNLTNLWWGNETQRVCWCILWGLEFQNHFRDLFQMMWSSWHLTNGIIWDTVRYLLDICKIFVRHLLDIFFKWCWVSNGVLDIWLMV